MAFLQAKTHLFLNLIFYGTMFFLVDAETINGTDGEIPMPSLNDNVQEIYNEIKTGTDAVLSMLAQIDTIPNDGVGDIMKAKVLPAFAQIVPYLATVTKAFQFMATVKPDAAELKIIEAAFDYMHLARDVSKRHAFEFKSKMDFYKTIPPLQQMNDNLRNISQLFEKVVYGRDKKATFKPFIHACSDATNGPEKELENLHMMIVKPIAGNLSIATATINHFSLDYPVVIRFFEWLIMNAFKLSIVRSACYGSLFQNDKDGFQKIGNESAKWINEIVESLAVHEKKMVDFDPEYLGSFKQSLQTVLNSPTFNETSQRSVNDKCKNVKLFSHTGSTDHEQICLGDKEVDKERIAVNYYLQSKYPWMKFAVAVMKDGRNPDTVCVGDGSRYAILKRDTVVVFVTWSKQSPDLEKYVQNVKPIIQTAMKKRGGERFKSTGDTHIRVKMVKSAREEIRNGLNNLNMNRIFCFFESDSEAYDKSENNKYRRSIYTADIGTFATHHINFSSSKDTEFWNFDHFVSFYI